MTRKEFNENLIGSGVVYVGESTKFFTYGVKYVLHSSKLGLLDNNVRKGIHSGPHSFGEKWLRKFFLLEEDLDIIKELDQMLEHCLKHNTLERYCINYVFKKP